MTVTRSAPCMWQGIYNVCGSGGPTYFVGGLHCIMWQEMQCVYNVHLTYHIHWFPTANASHHPEFIDSISPMTLIPSLHCQQG